MKKDEDREVSEFDDSDESDSVKTKKKIKKGKKTLSKVVRMIPKKIRRCIAVCLTVGIAVSIFGLIFGPKIWDFLTPKTGSFITRVESSLTKLKNTSSLTSIEYMYNGIVPVKNKKSDKTDFYVAYGGHVRAGINFEEIEVTEDPENENRIIITVPKVTIQDTQIDIDSLEMIYENQDAHTETVIATALAASREQIEKAASTDETLLEVGRENATRTLQALLQPLLEQLDPSIEVVFR